MELIDGRYRLDEQVGVGASGRVWRATDLVLSREVAIKIVDGARINDPTVIERFRREAIATAGMAHPNVVSVYDAGGTGDQHHLIMELLTGPSLAARIKTGRYFSVAEAAQIGVQVARGLAAAHDIGLTHRDIKPANIVMHHRGVKIVDFGIARLGQAMWQTLTVASTTIGTAAYMSPEQARGIEVGPASDVYSLGCVLMAMLTGTPPFTDLDPIETARAHTTDAPPRLRDRDPSLPVECDALLAAMLAKKPTDRPSVQRVARLLTLIAAGASGQASPGAVREALDGAPRSQATPTLTADEWMSHPPQRGARRLNQKGSAREESQTDPKPRWWRRGSR